MARFVPRSMRPTIRRTANRLGFEINRYPFSRRLAALCAEFGVEAVLDVGANSGQYATMLRDAGYRGLIVSCEPLSEPTDALRSKADRDPSWRVEQVAVGAEKCTTSVHVAGNSYSSSILPMLPAHLLAAPESAYIAEEAAQMSTVDALCREYGLVPDRTLLKIDVQGYEWDVLAGADEVLPTLAAVQVELSIVPLYEGQHLMPAVVDALAGYGLELWALEPGFSDPRGRMLQCDGVFAR